MAIRKIDLTTSVTNNPISQETQPQIGKSDRQGSDPIRRDVLKFLLSAPVVGTVGGGVTGAFLDPLSTSLENINHTQRIPGQVTKNFEILYSQLYSAISEVDNQETKVFFYDNFGNILKEKNATNITKDNGEVVQCWDTIKGKRTISQEWYDEVRENIKKDTSINTTNILATDSVGMVRGTEHKTFLNRVLAHGKKEVLNVTPSINRIEYARQIYMETETSLPKEVQNHLADICYGKAGVESTFDNSAKSDVKAGGIWQIMPATLKALGYTESDLQSYKKSTYASVKQYENIYAEIQQYTKKDFHTKEEYSPDSLTQIKDIFFEGDESAFHKYFLFPVLVNGYNAGGRGMADVINGFVQEYSTKKLSKKFGDYPNGYGYDLYWQMSQVAGEHKWYKSYGPKTSRYFFQSLGMAEAIREEMGIEKVAEDSPSENINPPIPPEQQSTRLASSLSGAAIGAIAPSLIKYLWKRIRKTRSEIKTVVSNTNSQSAEPKINRRGFLKTAAKAAGIGYGAVVAGIGGAGVYELVTGEDLMSSSEVENHEYQKSVEELSQHSAYKLSGDFDKKVSQFNIQPKDKNYKEQPLGNQHYPNIITPWTNANKKKLSLKTFEETSDIVDAIKSGKLIRLKELDAKEYRVQSAGRSMLTHLYKNRSIPRTANHPDFIAVSPQTEKLIKKIQQELNKEFQEKYSGLPGECEIRLQISSVARSKEYQTEILNDGSPNSSHIIGGTGFDIGFNFDIVDTKKGVFTEVRQYGNMEKLNERITACISHALYKMQHKMDVKGNIKQAFQGELFAIKERDHFHITGREGETTWHPTEEDIKKWEKIGDNKKSLS